MQIEPNVKLLKHITTALDEFKKAKQREGVHASDLLQPRKAYMQAIHPLPATDAEAAYWIVGQEHHAVLLKLLTGKDGTDEGSRFSEELGIWYSPDLYELQGEIKSSRLPFEVEGQEEAEKFFEDYEVQCQTYAAAVGLNYWHLIVVYICPTEHVEGKRCEECGRSSVTKKQEPLLRPYTFRWSDEEMEEHKRWIRYTRRHIEESIHQRSHTTLPLCKEAFCIKWKGQGRGKPRIPLAACKWFDLCKPEGRYEQVMNPPTKIVRKAKV